MSAINWPQVGMPARSILPHLRWLILLIFVAGYLLTAGKFQSSQGQYAIYSLISLAACALLLVRLDRYDKKNIAAWVALTIFLVTQYVRFYSLVLDPGFLRNMLSEEGWLALRSEEALIGGFRLATIAFAIFCLTIFTAFRWMAGNKQVNNAEVLTLADTRLYERASIALLVLVPILMLVLGYLAYIYHVGQLGSSTKVNLPFRMAGLIYYSRLVVIPALLMFLVYAAYRVGRNGIVSIGFFLLLTHGLMDVLIKSSRGALLLSLLTLVFLAMVGGYKLRRMEKYVFSAAIAIAAIAIPLTHQYRVLRNSGMGITTAMPGLVDLQWNFGTMVWDSIRFIYFRLPGIEMPIAILGAGGQPLGIRAFEVLSLPNGVADYLTYTVLSFPHGTPHSFAPSFLGWFYLIGGVPAVVVGGVAIGLLVTMFWKMLIELRLYSSHIAQTMFLLILFTAMTEGTLDVMRYYAVVIIASIISIEIAMRMSGAVKE